MGKAVQAALGEWISVADATDTAATLALRREYRLDLGESEAILVAETLGSAPLLMDERRGVPRGPTETKRAVWRCSAIRAIAVAS